MTSPLQLDAPGRRILGSNSFGPIALMWLFAIGWCSMSAAAVWMLTTPHHGRHHEAPIFLKAVVGLGFPIIAVAIVFFSIRSTVIALSFGRSFLVLDGGIPGPGDILEARIECGVPSRVEPCFHLDLRCMRSQVSGSKKSEASVQAEVLWRDEYDCMGESHADRPDGCIVPVRFRLAPDAMPAGADDRGEIQWILSVDASMPGRTFSDSFTVPVGDRSLRREHRELDIRPVPSDRRLPLHGQVRLLDDGPELTLCLPNALNPAGGMWAVILLVVCGWSAWAYAGAGDVGWSVVCAAAALLGFIWSVRAWLVSTVVTVGQAQIVIQRRLLGCSWRREIAANASTTILTRANGQSGNTPMTALQLKHDGRTIGICGYLRSKTEARRIADIMLKQLRPDGTVALAATAERRD